MVDPDHLRERARELQDAGELDPEVAELFYSLADQAEHIEQLRALVGRLSDLILRFEDHHGEEIPEPAADEFGLIVETAREVQSRVGEETTDE